MMVAANNDGNSKKTNKRFFSKQKKHLFEAISSLCAGVYCMQKLETIPFPKTLKKFHYGPILWPLVPKKPKTRLLLK